MCSSGRPRRQTNPLVGQTDGRAGPDGPLPGGGAGAQSRPMPACLPSGAVDGLGMAGGDGGPPTATCLQMCPEAEFARRRRQGLLHPLELGADGRPDAALAVKEYSRPAAGKAPPRPDELRPPDVLLATARHLLALAGSAAAAGRETAKGEDRGDGRHRGRRGPRRRARQAASGGPDGCSEAEAYAFVADRLRALRLDLALQGRCGRPGVAALERSLAYLLHAGHRLCDQPPARFDAALHRQQVHETFASLRRAYLDGEDGGGGGGAQGTSEPRVQALFLLYNLGSPEALWQVLLLSKSIRESADISVALEITWAFLERNFARLFRLARGLPYLPSCALHPHLLRIRRLALLTFSHGFSARNCSYPLARLAQLLATDGTEEAAELCRNHGLAVAEGFVVFQKGSFRDSSPMELSRSRLLVDGKWGHPSLLDFSEAVCS